MHSKTENKQQFFEISGFPNVLGAVDGTHIAIKDNVIYFNFFLTFHVVLEVLP